MKNNQMKDVKIHKKQKYQIRLDFDWNECYYLWPDCRDAYTNDRFHWKPITPQELNIPQPLINLLDSLCDEYFSSFDDYPLAPRLWTFDQSLGFDVRMQSAMEMLRDCLKDTCDIIDEFPVPESYDFVKEAYTAELRGDKTISDKWYSEKYGWDGVLRGLQLALLVSKNRMLCEYAKNIIWNGICKGKTLGIDKDNVIALLYNCLGDVSDPRKDAVLWNIVTTAYELDKDSDYNPLKDEKILAILRKFETICIESKFKDLGIFLERRRDFVKFNWRITDDIRNKVFVADETKEKIKIRGEFQMTVNGVSLDVYGQNSKEIQDRSSRCKDIPSILNELGNKIAELEDGETLNVTFLQNNLARHTVTRTGCDLYLKQYNRNTNEEEWCIRIGYFEFCIQAGENIRQFIKYIRKENPDLPHNESISMRMFDSETTDANMQKASNRKWGPLTVWTAKANVFMNYFMIQLFGPSFVWRLPDELVRLLLVIEGSSQYC